MDISDADDLTQAAAPTKTASPTRCDPTCRALPGSREGRVIHWLRAVAGDARIGVLHRFALIGIGLHHRRNDSPGAVAAEIGVDRACVLRAIDVGIRRGWLAIGRGRRLCPALRRRPQTSSLRGAAMTAPPTSIDRAVAQLFKAMVGYARGDAATVAAARGELVALAGETEDFEAQLTAVVLDRLARLCPNATRDELKRAVRLDVRRHVTGSPFLAKLEPWGHA
jgi:hypothetical protein